MLLTFAWRNLWRHPRRTWITVVAMAAGLVFCLGMTTMLDGMYRGMFDGAVTERLGHARLHHPEYPKKRAMWETIPDGETLAIELEALQSVRASTSRVFGHVLLGVGDQSTGTMLVGVDPAREDRLSGLASSVGEGAFLAAGPQRQIVLGSSLAERVGASVGNEMVVLTQAADGSMGNELFAVVGILSERSVVRDQRVAWVHLHDLQELLALESQVHEIAVVASDREAIAPMVEAIRDPAAARQLLLRSWDEIDPTLASLLEVGEVAGSFLLWIVFGLAGLGVLNTMMMAVFERTRELGVCRALGLRSSQVVRLVVTETLMLAVLAMLIAAPFVALVDVWLVFVGIDLTPWTGNYSAMGMSVDRYVTGHVRPDRMWNAVLGLLVVALLAGIWPAVRAATLRPVDAMRRR